MISMCCIKTKCNKRDWKNLYLVIHKRLNQFYCLKRTQQSWLVPDNFITAYCKGIRTISFFSDKQTHILSKGKCRIAYREYTRRRRPHNKKPKKKNKSPPTLNWRNEAPPHYTILPTPTYYKQKNSLSIPYHWSIQGEQINIGAK